MRKLWTGIVFIACFVFVAPAFAQSAFPVGGSGFASAVTLAPGEYQSTREVVANEYEYYKLNVTKGQSVKIKLTTGKEGYANATLWNFEKEEIGNGYMIHENDSTTFYTLIPYTGVVYLGIGDDTLPGNTYKITLESGVPTPTPDEFGNPGATTPGSPLFPFTTSTPDPRRVTSGSLVTPVVIGLAAIIVIVIVVLVIRSKNGKK